jgi:predicted tellurium resistance membrane protein TerC
VDWYQAGAHQDEDEEISSSGSLWRTAVTITVADVIMSMDNVLAVAAAGKGHLLLVALGVLISIPIIVAGSKLVLAILNRFPVVILLGGALIGWIAGSMGDRPHHRSPVSQAPDALPLIAGASARRWCCWKDFAQRPGTPGQLNARR